MSHRLTDNIANFTLFHDRWISMIVVKALSANANIAGEPFIFELLQHFPAIYIHNAIILRRSLSVQSGNENENNSRLIPKTINLRHSYSSQQTFSFAVFVFSTWWNAASHSVNFDGHKDYRKSLASSDSSLKCHSQLSSQHRALLWCFWVVYIDSSVRNLRRNERIFTKLFKFQGMQLTANKFRTSFGVIYHFIRLVIAALWHN